MAEAPIGGSNLDSGGGAQVGNLSGTTGASARNKSAVDAAQFKVLNQEFDKLNKHLKTYKQELTGVIKQTKEWANALKGVSQGMGSVSGGGGGSSYLPAAGSGTTVASGNQNTVTQIVNVPGPGVGG